MRCGSKSQVAPRPWHDGQAPCGELNENARGDISGTLMPHTTHASLRENSRSPPSSELITTTSSASVERDLDRFGEAPLDAAADDQPIDDDLDVVVAAAVERDVFFERAQLAVDARLGEAARAQRLQLLLELALAAADDRRHHVDARVLRIGHHQVDDALERLRGDLAAAVRAVRHADVGEQQAEVVVDFGDRADGRSRVRAGGLLLDRDRRRQALDQVDVRLLHLLEKLPRVGGQRLDVAALPFGVERVERQRRLARPRQPGDDHELVARDVDVDVLQVVDARAADGNPVVRHWVLLRGLSASPQSPIVNRRSRQTAASSRCCRCQARLRYGREACCVCSRRARRGRCR